MNSKPNLTATLGLVRDALGKKALELSHCLSKHPTQSASVTPESSEKLTLSRTSCIAGTDVFVGDLPDMPCAPIFFYKMVAECLLRFLYVDNDEQLVYRAISII